METNTMFKFNISKLQEPFYIDQLRIDQYGSVPHIINTKYNMGT